MLVITGSNMSGKSTLLRTVGINTVLALAGAPVRARSLRLSPLAVGASIRVQDSLQDGESRFYAEIKRVRQVLDLASGPIPALFLMDEIFDGTNSAERRVGAEAVVRSLLERKAIGLVTSHDLALAEIAVSLAPRATNLHFEDHLEGDRMAFDYRLKPGPVRKGNALGLMRAVGLEV
jgi:DNA mismatch repair ATPase MutS